MIVQSNQSKQRFQCNFDIKWTKNFETMPSIVTTTKKSNVNTSYGVFQLALFIPLVITTYRLLYEFKNIRIQEYTFFHKGLFGYI